MAKKKKRKKRSIWKWVLLAVLLLIIAVAGICYAGVSNYYTDHFFKGTVINGMDCSNLTVNDVKYKIEDQIMTYTLTIRERNDVTERLMASQVGMTYADDRSVDQLMLEQESVKWIFRIFNSEETSVSVSSNYDEEVLEKNVKALGAFQEGGYTSPQDAELVETETGYEISPEVEGNELDYSLAYSAIKEAVEAGATEVDLDALGCYKEPSVRSDDATLNSLVESANKYLTANITYDFGKDLSGNDRIVTVDATQIKQWLVRGDDDVFSLDTDAVTEFVKTQMAYKTDTFGLTHTFKTHAGNTIELKGGDYGWCINREKTAEELIAAIEAGETTELEPVYKYKGKDRSENDIGGTYVEISIDEQKMWCYKDGVCIVETDVVTGNPNRGNATPMNSVWAIDAKKSPATLGTLDTMGYSSPVTYWMPFTGNVGIHDADGWRSSYGGSIYKSNGSHGCVNTPLSAAKKIYEAVEIGTAVVVYGS